MRILLLGEYSRLHNSLKEGLQYLGHEVTLISTGDSFKAFPSDIDVSSNLRHKYLINKWWQLIYKLTGFDYFKKDIYKNLMKIAPKLKDFDVVQLINEDAFQIYPQDEIIFFKKIFNQNKSVFLSACGEDSHVIDFYKSGKMRYSILDPFIKRPELVNESAYSYKYLTKPYKALHQFVINRVKAVIPSDFDYAIPYAEHEKSAPMIPNPINIDRISYKPLKIENKINIFFGINRLSFYKKGSDIILEALKIIEKKYKNKVQVVLAENLPYDDYINKYKEAHILIDQLYGYDQGYNALESMAQGKCVLTGAEKEFESYYNLTEPVAVNVLPNVDDVVEKLSYLIEHPNEILKISKNARHFIEQHHDYKQVAQKYIDIWRKYGV